MNLVTYIKEAKKSGFSEEEIKTHLFSHGFSKSEINESFGKYTTKRILSSSIAIMLLFLLIATLTLVIVN